MACIRFKRIPARRASIMSCASLALVGLLALLTACSSTSGTSTVNGGTPTAGATATATGSTAGATPTNAPTSATATCGSVLPGAGAANAGSALIYPMSFPTGSVSTSAAQTISGNGLFTVYQLNVCSPNSSTSAVNAYFSSALTSAQHGWGSATNFPYDGGLLQSCTGQCWTDANGGPVDYLVFDQQTDHGNGVISYRMQYAISPDFPSCNSTTFSGSSAQNLFFLPGFTPSVPLPPLSEAAPDDASGGQRGFEICSPGDAASVTAFMEKELPATGWSRSSTGTSSNSCLFTSECWVNGSAAISFNTVTDATQWVIAWRQQL